MKTTFIKPNEVKRNWWIIDATDKTLGRISVIIARLLMGKHKVDYTPYADCGDYVIVINAEKLNSQAIRQRIKNIIAIQVIQVD